MLLNINDLREQLTIIESFKLVDNLYKLFENSNTFEWDIEQDNQNTFEWDIDNNIQSRFQKILNTIKDYDWSNDKILSYLKRLYNKINRLPLKIKLALLKVIIITFSFTLSSTEIIDNVLADSSIKDKEILINTIDNEYQKLKINVDVKKYPTVYSNLLINFLKWEEGSIKHKGKPVLTAYDIGDGMITIGYGHAEKKRVTKLIPGKTVITEQEAENLLIDDLQTAKNGIINFCKEVTEKNNDIIITQNMFDAMVSMAYNMGVTGFRSTKIAEYIKNNEITKAGKIIKKSKIFYTGHEHRRNRESFLFSSKKKINLRKLINL